MVFDAEDYEDFRMKYNKFDIEFIINNLKKFVASDYINKFYKKNSYLILQVIKKLQNQLNLVVKAQNKYASAYCYENVLIDFKISISLNYEEIITLLFYLNCLHLKENHEYRRRDELVSELSKYIGKHKAWLDFRKLTIAVE
ncbi:hypothetical protein [Clostridium gasigenes]|uniref:hypothetical protein n=1 Tax=Clostridium gasigenes TaxID=94869 RepID=UPI001C0D299F|nr:hypothetical protein [Clostridium gasigenes]MBU3102920.1 hypothetical protein [Clostridium gasigenes]